MEGALREPNRKTEKKHLGPSLELSRRTFVGRSRSSRPPQRPSALVLLRSRERPTPVTICAATLRTPTTGAHLTTATESARAATRHTSGRAATTASRLSAASVTSANALTHIPTRVRSFESRSRRPRFDTETKEVNLVMTETSIAVAALAAAAGIAQVGSL